MLYRPTAPNFPVADAVLVLPAPHHENDCKAYVVHVTMTHEHSPTIGQWKALESAFQHVGIVVVGIVWIVDERSTLSTCQPLIEDAKSQQTETHETYDKLPQYLCRMIVEKRFYARQQRSQAWEMAVMCDPQTTSTELALAL